MRDKMRRNREAWTVCSFDLQNAVASMHTFSCGKYNTHIKHKPSSDHHYICIVVTVNTWLNNTTTKNKERFFHILGKFVHHFLQNFTAGNSYSIKYIPEWERYSQTVVWHFLLVFMAVTEATNTQPSDSILPDKFETRLTSGAVGSDKMAVKNHEKWDGELRHLSVLGWAMLFSCPVFSLFNC